MHSIVIIGGGGHSKVLISVLKKTAYVSLGYTDLLDRGSILGVPYLGLDAILPDILLNHTNCRAIIGIGKIDASGRRLDMQYDIADLGFIFPDIVSPQAIINEAVYIDEGTVVFDGVVVNSGSAIGKACILNTHCTIEHDCHLGDNVHIASGVTLSGAVTIGRNTMVGTGAAVIQQVSICEGCVVGAGSTVVKDITVPGIYAGSPAKRIK